MRHFINLLHFGFQQARSCLFPLVIFLALAVTKFVEIPFIPRYDLILFICLMTQILMIVFKYETIDELKVICVFHLIGLALELYKVHMGSWVYPEEGWTKFFGVPLYSGFMYASVASYICQAWRRFDLRIRNWPPSWLVVILSAAVYFNFFTHHFIPDLRWVLKVLVILLFLRTFVYFTVNNTTYPMPLSLSFVLIGFFIWIAENIATFFGAWAYPNQEQTWSLVHIGKISSWLLLVIVSIMIVALLKRLKGKREEVKSNTYKSWLKNV
ncbi:MULTISPECIES: DUF817 domain-containing protein [Bacillus]|uniref:DUF817 domain-containing protein n=2 Tax=Bacillus TaxID=1386 RepID=A0A0M4FNQ1_9BACI|nr:MULTISPECIES: DUF817 domain-containing protein [Bacillus]ALC80271.1 hypothetical protein AM592_00645 [Bacillus gobiensis]MBP1083898.1 uncharacterized membrane protein YoaT (DUF817 family) [Bacillus capparidis]MED1098378.1 DUF817 domain-containing protein [Bacillus capparidis]